jgi:hypothetical protein
MYEVAKRSAVLAAATGGLLLAGAACASADATTLPALGAADVLSGNSVEIPVNVPVNVCGIGVLGMSADGSSCSSTGAAATGGGGGTGGGSARSADVLSGNSVSIPVTIPANVCDIGLLGMSADAASCTSMGAAATGGAGGTVGGSASSSSVLSGNSVSVPVTAPANVCGIGVLGMSADGSSCSSTGAAVTAGSGGSAGSADVLSGNSVSLPVSIPANVCETGVLGMSAESAACSSTVGAATGNGGATTSTPSALSCNAGQAPATVAAAPQTQSTGTTPVQSSALGTAEAVSLPLSSVVPLASSAIGALHDSPAINAPFHPTSSAARPGSGRLAETGVEGLMSMGMAGGGALLSGGVLTALAFKGKHDTTDF